MCNTRIFQHVWFLYFAEGKTIEDIEAEDKEEEEEAKKIQTRLAANLSEEDYDLNLLEVLNLLCFLKLWVEFRCLHHITQSPCTLPVVF